MRRDGKVSSDPAALYTRTALRTTAATGVSERCAALASAMRTRSAPGVWPTARCMSIIWDSKDRGDEWTVLSRGSAGIRETVVVLRRFNVALSSSSGIRAFLPTWRNASRSKPTFSSTS